MKCEKCEAFKALDEAHKTWNEAFEAWDKAGTALNEAFNTKMKAYYVLDKITKARIETEHAKGCKKVKP